MSLHRACCCGGVASEGCTNDLLVHLADWEECLACYSGSPPTRLKAGSLSINGTYTATKVGTGAYWVPGVGYVYENGTVGSSTDYYPIETPCTGVRIANAGWPGTPPRLWTPTYWICGYTFSATNVGILNAYAGYGGACPDISVNPPVEDQHAINMSGTIIVRCDGQVVQAQVTLTADGYGASILIRHLDGTYVGYTNELVPFGDPVESNGDQAGVNCSPESIAAGNVRHAVGGTLIVEGSTE